MSKAEVYYVLYIHVVDATMPTSKRRRWTTYDISKARDVALAVATA